MAEELLPLGPWPLGMDNFHAVSHAVFQLPGEGGPPSRLRLATDVVLDDEGWPSNRSQAATSQILVAGEGLVQVGSRVFYQDSGSLFEVGNPAALISGLVAFPALADFGGRIFGTDGTTYFEVDSSSVVRGWGLPVPLVALAASAGSTFEAGTYQVECAFVDTRNEGGTSATEVITLTETSDIEVTVTGLDSRVAGINQYVSLVNQPAVSFAKLVATAGVGAQVFSAAAATTVNSPPLTKWMEGPLAGAVGVFSFRAFLMLFRDGVVLRSQAQEPHLFRPEEWIYQVPGTIRGGGGLPTGFALGTDQGIWWLTGEEPPYVGVQKTFEPVLSGAFVTDGWRLPFLQTPDPVVLFVQKSGLVAVLPSGAVLPVTQDRYHVDLDTYSAAQFSYVEQDGARQLLVGLV